MLLSAGKTSRGVEEVLHTKESRLKAYNSLNRLLLGAKNSRVIQKMLFFKVHPIISWL